ncbi:MAG: helix-turn-helix domain-containing protein [Desulfobulbaceae bacterium]|nr:helix-turn-helix domain-containing protein [Desulfobulbaceae bacterium]
MTLGERIKQLRNEKGLTQEKLGGITKIHPNPYLTTKGAFSAILLHFDRKNQMISIGGVRDFICSAIKFL